MTETKSERRPRRDPSGRLSTIGDLLGTALAGLVIGVVVLLAFEGVLSLTRVSEFGHTSGWLTLILPLWLFTEEFRAARDHGPYRIVVAVLAAGFGVAAGMSFAGLAAPAFPVFGVPYKVKFLVSTCSHSGAFDNEYVNPAPPLPKVPLEKVKLKGWPTRATGGS